MSSPDQLASSLEIIDATDRIIVDKDATPFESNTGEKRKRDGRIRSRVWQHFTRLEKKPGGREECQCNHCGQFYACSSRCGTTHLNRHIFDGGCPKYRPTFSESPAPISYVRADPQDDPRATPLRDDSKDNITIQLQENLERVEAQLAQVQDENLKLQQEKDSLVAQKESLEQLLLSMATETARLTEENSKLKDDCSRLEEEKQKIVTREEFTRLQTQVSKLKEDFERDRRGFPAAAVAAIAQLHKNRG